MNTFGFYSLCNEGSIYYIDIFVVGGKKDRPQIEESLMSFHMEMYYNNKNSELSKKIKDIHSCEVDILEIHYENGNKNYISNALKQGLTNYRESYGMIGYKNTGAKMTDPFSFYDMLESLSIL